MKKIVATVGIIAAVGFVSAASAADMPVKAAPMATSSYNWTGFYVGGNVGYGWGNRSANYSPDDAGTVFFFAPLPGGDAGAPSTTPFKDSGFLGGLQLGYNWQLNRTWVVGLEADFSWSGMKGSGISSGFSPNVGPFTNTVTEKVNWFSTVRARLGYLPMDNLLTYITGGLAFGQIDRTGTYAVGGSALGIGSGGFGILCPGGFAPCVPGSSSSTASGWTVGAGFEYAVLKNWTLKAEYLYVSLGRKSVTQTALNGNGAIPSSFDANFSNAAFNIARVGFNYHF